MGNSLDRQIAKEVRISLRDSGEYWKEQIVYNPYQNAISSLQNVLRG